MTFVDEYADLLESKRSDIVTWMSEKRSQVPIPIYGSVDIRDAGWKVSVVDANHFPAGFNNIGEEEKPATAELLKTHIQREFPDCSWVHLYPESHTRNTGYVENLIALKELLEIASFRCTVGSVDFEGLGHLNGISGPMKLDTVTQIEVDGKEVMQIDGKTPDLILLNNDLTDGLVEGLGSQMVSPPPSMGWHRRRKSQHYEALQEYVDEMAEMLGIDSWHLMTEWFVSKDKCLDKEACRIEPVSYTHLTLPTKRIV